MIAGGWIRQPVAEPGAPQIRRLASALGEDRVTSFGRVVQLKCYAFTFYPDGNLGRCEQGELSEAAGYSGDPAAFRERLFVSGVLDASGVIFDWADLQGAVLAKRARDRERMRTQRRESRDRPATRRAMVARTDVRTDERTGGGKDRSAGGRPPRVFTPPTATEVQAYLAKLGERRFTGEQFCNSYERSGWRLKGGDRMVSWQAAVRTWRDVRDRDGRGATGTPGNGGAPKAEPSAEDLEALRVARKSAGAEVGP